MQTDKTGDSLAALYADFVTLWQTAPMPAPRADVHDRSTEADAVAVALAWGWMVRVSRTGEAAMKLDEAGFSDEAAPLIRSMLEHTIRLRWAETSRPTFVEVALRMRASSLKAILTHQLSYTFSQDLVDKMEAMIAEQDASFSGIDNLKHLKHVFETDRERLGNLYQMWLLETQVSHPTLMSAQSYFTRNDRGFQLHDKPVEQDSVGLAACMAILGAVDSYAKIAGLHEQHFDEGLKPLLERLAPFMLGFE